MKKSFIHSILIVMAAVVIMVCSGFTNSGVIDRPFINSALTSAISFRQIALSDTATVIHARLTNPPGNWVSLSPKSVIIADGVSYPLKSTTGITPDTRTLIPDSGHINITMTFPAIPAEVKTIDFSEGPKSSWKIWGIDLTGTADHSVNQHDLPAKVLADRSLPLPETVITKADSTTINIHILGYHPEMGDKLRWGANLLRGQIGIDTPVIVDEEGNATVKYLTSAPSKFFLISLGRISNFGPGVIAAPGETLDLYVDTHLSGIYNMRDNNETVVIPDNYRSMFVDGVYSNIHNITGGKYFSMDLYSGELGDYRMNGDDYTDLIISTYKNLSDSIDASGLGPDGLRYFKAILMGDLVTAAADARLILRRNFYDTHHDWQMPVPDDSIPAVLSAENIRTIAELIDFNNYDMLLSDEIKGNENIAVWENAGIDPGVVKTVYLYYTAFYNAENGVMDTTLNAALRERCEPLADEVEAHYASVKARLDALGSDQMAATPDVAPDEVFDAIIAPHKGKVIMVDLWNTWCGPCRSAIAETEPEKSGELSSDDIVWIYIANQTSPRGKYLTMINDIKGIHYRLEDDQWRAICNRFNVDGIPFYILVDREGNVEARPDLRNHSAYKKAILDHLAR